MSWPLANPSSFGPVGVPFLDADRCREVVTAAEADPRWAEAGIYSGATSTDTVDTDERSASSLPAAAAGFPVDALVAALADLNDQHFRFQLSGIPAADAPSVIRYSAESADHFREHRDVGGFAPTRKLTYVVQLTEPHAYDGGDLVFSALGSIARRDVGWLIAFPSYETHHVTPVLRGTRHAVVGWVHGSTLR